MVERGIIVARREHEARVLEAGEHHLPVGAKCCTNLRKAKEAGALMDPEEVAEALEFMLTRKRGVTVRDVIIMPTAFERM